MLQFLQSPDEFNEANVILLNGVEPAREWKENVPAEDQKQRVGPDGLPQWDLFCSVKSGRQVLNFRVRVSAATEPAWDPGRVRFGGLQAIARQDGVRLVISNLTAQSWTQDDRPSLKRRDEVPVPPPMPAPKAA